MYVCMCVLYFVRRNCLGSFTKCCFLFFNLHHSTSTTLLPTLHHHLHLYTAMIWLVAVFINIRCWRREDNLNTSSCKV